MLSLFLMLLSCPPNSGVTRWEGFNASFRALGRRFEVQGALWDRDKDGRPSNADLFRIDSARMGRTTLSKIKGPVTIRGRLAKLFARRFRKIGAKLSKRCFPVPKAGGLPRFNSPAALARYLKRKGSGDQPSATEQIRSKMQGQAELICRGAQHISEAALAQRLRARRKGARKLLRRISVEVAREYALKCARMELKSKP